jgi:hypothetical protein
VDLAWLTIPVLFGITCLVVVGILANAAPVRPESAPPLHGRRRGDTRRSARRVRALKSASR